MTRNDEELFSRIKNNPYLIKYVENPSEELQLIAIRHDPSSVCNIQYPTEKVQNTILRWGGIWWISDIRHPSESIQDYVIKNDPQLFIKIHNLSTKILNANKDIIIKMLLQRIRSGNIYNDDFGDMLTILERHVTWPELDIINKSLNSDIS